MSVIKRNAMLLAALAIAGESFMATGRGEEMTVFLPKEPAPPKGCKEYFFNNDGEFSTSTMRKDLCVFKCFAVNDKNAVRKFNKWKSNNA